MVKICTKEMLQEMSVSVIEMMFVKNLIKFLVFYSRCTSRTLDEKGKVTGKGTNFRNLFFY